MTTLRRTRRRSDNTVTYREAISQALAEEMRVDDRVILLGEDVARYGGAYAVSKGLLEEFGPNRVIDTPMSESVIVGAALGAAAVGGRPVAEIMYMDFMTLVMDQLVNQAAKLHFMFGGQMSAPMVVRTQQGTGRGAGSQHSQSLEAWFAHVPGLKVLAPATPADAKGLLKSAIRDDDPVLFIEHKGLYARRAAPISSEHLVPIGCANISRDGSDISIIAWSNMVYTALEAAETLAAQGVSAQVIDLRSIAPLDWALLVTEVARTGRAVVAHEACRTGGLGGEIAAELSERLFAQLHAPIRRVTTPDVVLPANTALERELVPTADAIVGAVLETMGWSR